MCVKTTKITVENASTWQISDFRQLHNFQIDSIFADKKYLDSKPPKKSKNKNLDKLKTLLITTSLY